MAMSARDGVRTMAHVIERRRKVDGDGRGRVVTAMSFCPGPTQQREKGGEEGRLC